MRQTICFALLVASCAARPPETPGTDETEVIYSDRMHTWFEGAWPDVRMSADGTRAVFGTHHKLELVDVDSGDDEPFAEGRAMTFRGNELVSQDSEGEWSPQVELPANVDPRWSPDLSRVAFVPSGAREAIRVVDDTGDRNHALPGVVSALEWSPDGERLYALSHDDGGLSTLSRVDVNSGRVDRVVSGLDAPRRAHSIGVSPDGTALFLPLASEGSPATEARHLPRVDRDLDIYRVRVADGALAVTVDSPGEEISVAVVGETLYWTRSRHQQSIVALPSTGGEAHLVAEGGQISYWSPGGNRVAFTIGDLRATDSPLNFDVDVIDVDGDARPIAEPRRLIVGYHEDFTPAWSPDGAWLAYHSHRSPGPVASYMGEGSTDDVFLLRAGAATTEEIRLTDFGWEVGMIDWSPDGRRLAFATWDRGGAPGLAKPWVARLNVESGQGLGFERVPFPAPLRSVRVLAWSPVADELAIENDDGGGAQSIWTLGLDGDARKLVDIECATYCGLDWTPDGETIVFSALVEDRMQLFAIARSGGEPRQLTHDSGSVLLPQVSPDGEWITATRISLDRELMRRSLGRAGS